MRLIDAGARTRGGLRWPAMRGFLPQVGDEVLDIRCSDLSQWSIDEVLNDRLQPVVNRLANRELLREDVALLVVFLFSPAGAWTATQRLANTFEIGTNPDELTGTTEANFFDTNGNLTATVCATVLGRRLE